MSRHNRATVGRATDVEMWTAILATGAVLVGCTGSCRGMFSQQAVAVEADERSASSAAVDADPTASQTAAAALPEIAQPGADERRVVDDADRLYDEHHGKYFSKRCLTRVAREAGSRIDDCKNNPPTKVTVDECIRRSKEVMEHQAQQECIVDAMPAAGGAVTPPTEPGAATGAAGPKVNPGVSIGDPTIMGSLGKDVVKKVAQGNLRQIRFCYEEALAKEPNIAGNLVVKFVISGSGSVATAQVAQKTISSADLETCTAGRVRTWEFPKPKGGGVVIVTLPFDFQFLAR